MKFLKSMKVKFRYITLILFAAVVLGLSIWLVSVNQFNKGKISIQSKPVTVQLVPLPMIVDSATGKDSKLYELLLNKKTAQVTIANANIDIEPIFASIPLNLKNLSINFTFNEETNRVEFQGQSNNLRHLEIFGHYELTSRNSIRYYIEIRDKYKQWVIDSTYAPAYKDNESEHEEIVTGSFSLNAKDLLQAVYSFDMHGMLPKWPLTLHGEFVKQDNLFYIKNLYLKAHELETNIYAKIKDKDLTLDIALSDLNLDEVFEYISAAEINKALSIVFKKIAPFNMKATLNCNKVTFHGVSMQSFFTTFVQEKKVTNNLEISKLKFSFPDDTVFHASGKISRAATGIVINGLFNVPDMQASILTKFLGTQNYVGTNLISLSSKFKLTPMHIKLKEFKLSERDTVVTGDLSFSKYVTSKMLIGNMAINNYNTKPASFIQFMLHQNSLLSGTENLDYEVILKRNKKEKFLKDIALKFSNLKTIAGTVQKISTRYIESPESIELKYFNAVDPEFNVKGNISLHIKKMIPNFVMRFEGDRANIAIFNDLILKPLVYKTSSDKDSLFSIPQFNTMTGKIDVHLKDSNKEAYISGIDCKAKLNRQTLTLDRCVVDLFGAHSSLNGTIGLGNNLQYNISFSQKDVNMKAFVSWLLNADHKITGSGRADIKGHITASNFNTNDEMIKALQGMFELKSDQISLTDVSVESLAFKYGTIKDLAKARQREETVFHNVRGIFNIDRGMITSKDLSFITKNNIHGKTNLNYALTNKNTKGVLSLAYFDRLGKIDGFNVTFYGDVRALRTKLGTYVSKHRASQ